MKAEPEPKAVNIEYFATYNLGLIPGLINRDADKSINENLAAHYPGGALEPLPPGVKLSSDLTYKYPGDPPQKPKARIDRGGERLYIYAHAFAVLIDGAGERYYGRLD